MLATVHVCDSTRPACTCGRAWDYRVSPEGDAPRFTSAAVVARFEALYGAHPYAVRLGGAQ